MKEVISELADSELSASERYPNHAFLTTPKLILSSLSSVLEWGVFIVGFWVD
jgi:hypothetical protein